ncbi:MAG: hypothetical protein ACREEX_02355 [Caulobacteraceae bacterium]
MSSEKSRNPVQGEGDYISARKFDEEEARFVKSGKVKGKAREAAKALGGPEGEELEKARKASARGESLASSKGGGGRD